MAWATEPERERTTGLAADSRTDAARCGLRTAADAAPRDVTALRDTANYQWCDNVFIGRNPRPFKLVLVLLNPLVEIGDITIRVLQPFLMSSKCGGEALDGGGWRNRQRFKFGCE